MTAMYRGTGTFLSPAKRKAKKRKPSADLSALIENGNLSPDQLRELERSGIIRFGK